MSDNFLLFPQKSSRCLWKGLVQKEAISLAELEHLWTHPSYCPSSGAVSPHHTSILTVSRWYFGSLARFTFSVRVCQTRTYKTTFVLVQSPTELTWKCFSECGISTFVQLFALGSSSSTVVICFRKSDSCIPGWEPRRLNTAFGCDRITWRLTANPWREGGGNVKKNL